MLFFMSGLGNCAYVPELFPTGVRLRGARVSSMAGRAASIAAPQAVIALFAYNGVAGVTLTLVAMLVVQAIIVATLGFETTSRPIGSQFASRNPAQLAHEAAVVTAE